jgi:GNAT superfamily N-acetyltransferase
MTDHTDSTNVKSAAVARFLDAPQEVIYRVIENEELLKLRPLFDTLGWALPDPDFAKAVVAEADGLILGFGIVQFITHAEPMWVHPSVRGSGLAEGLADKMCHYIEEDCHIKKYISCAKPGSFAARLCENRGYVASPATMYIRNVREPK